MSEAVSWERMKRFRRSLGDRIAKRGSVGETIRFDEREGLLARS